MGRLQSKIIDASKQKPSTGSKVKAILIKILIAALVIIGAYGFGTFKPNPWVVKSIQQEEDKKMVEPVSYTHLTLPTI